MPATTKTEVSKEATTMWPIRVCIEGLRIAAMKSLTMNFPFTHSNPAGVCIQELAAKIQKDERRVPKETRHVARKWISRRTLVQPKIMMPRNPASRKKAVSTSKARSGEKTLATACEKREKLVPNSNSRTTPETAPIAKLMAKIFTQN